MGATIAYMFQLHCYDLCFLRCTHPGHRMYVHGLALVLRYHHRCIIQRPDYAQVLEDFEAIHDPSSYSTVHHEEGHSWQVAFQRDFLSWIKFRFQYLITSSGTTCSLSPIDPNCWLQRYSFNCTRIKMSTWLTTFAPKTKQSHRAWRIGGHCELEKRLTFFSTSVLPLGV